MITKSHIQLNESALTQVMAELSYRRMRQNIYKAEWSTGSVEHFLYTSTWGDQKELFAIDFGLRNPAAEDYSIQCLREHGGQVYSVLKHDPRIDCKMRSALGRIARWEPLSSLSMIDISQRELLFIVKRDLKTYLLGILSQLTTLDVLFRFLLSDTPLLPWFVSNGAIRAAHIAGIALQMGMEPIEIESVIRPSKAKIAYSLTFGLDTDEYIRRISSGPITRRA